ncbi:MAG: rhomboid family intramembrane serine protease [Candidatus Thiodiazotropha sp. LLP2]
MTFTTRTKIIGDKGLPLVTIVLVLINLLIFIVWQSDDNATLSEILSEYQSSGLHDYEKAQYDLYVDKYMTAPKRAASNSDDITPWELFERTKDDTRFQDWLLSGNHSDIQDQDYALWKEKHTQLINRFEDITTVEYGLVTAKVSGIALITHMFLHAGFIHLLSNLLILGLLGLMIERVLGSGLFLGIYLASGLVAAILALFTNPASFVPAVGATGAVSGMLGMVTVFFGHKQSAALDDFGVDTSLLSIPLLALLPLWIGIELLQFVLYTGGQIQYVAHIGCFLITAALSLLLKQTQWVSDVEVYDEAGGSSDLVPRLTSAKDLCLSENYDEALRLLRRLYRETCREREFLSLYYQCSRMSPESVDFHQAARAIFNMVDRDDKSVRLIRTTYIDYVRLAQPGPRFTEKILFCLAELFVDQKWCDEVDGIMSLMHKKRAACLFASNLPYRYAKLLDEEGRTVEGTDYLKSIV